MIQDLKPSYENVKRADRKFRELKALVGRYIDSGPHYHRMEDNADLTYVICGIHEGPPEDVAWDAVDVVLRLRSALDKAVVALVARNGHGISGVGFPFGGIDGNSGKPLPYPTPRMTGKHGIKKKITAAQWDVISAYKPYPGGNDALWGINQIANADKHGSDLVRAHTLMNTDGFGLSRADGTQTFISNPANVPIPYDKERERVVLAFSGGSGDFKAEQAFSVSVVFSDLRPVTGKNVLVTLNQQIRLVDNILKGMCALF